MRKVVLGLVSAVAVAAVATAGFASPAAEPVKEEKAAAKDAKAEGKEAAKEAKAEDKKDAGHAAH